ncbi:hypothetical protein QN277_017305 [Acacia crassicarpa]|nr:hypothetical protein QN277_017305 [Acacia crassicarpa]
MESPNAARFAVPVFSCFLYLWIAATSSLNPVWASQVCEFPAIFNFGDSNSDTGGLAAALWGAPPLPNGQTYFRRATGRYSDGRLIIDFIAQSFGLPYLDAYLNSVGTNFTHGVNFATSASTIELPSIIFPHLDGFSPFYLGIQYDQYMGFMSKSDFLRLQGGVFASLVPKHEFFNNALYTFDIGQNDLGRGFFGNKTIKQVNDSMPDIIDQFSRHVENIHQLGARYLWIHNTGPIGCLPYILVKFPTAERDEFGCAKAHNEVAQYFNHKLKEAVVKLRQSLSPPAAITYVDVYSVKYSLYSNPGKYGFEKPLEACCGYGENKYKYGIVGCGYSKVVNGSEVFGRACGRPSVRVNWDGIHYTEAANHLIFHRISSGAFSDPPIPLNMSCRHHNHLPQI